MNLISYLTTGK